MRLDTQTLVARERVTHLCASLAAPPTMRRHAIAPVHTIRSDMGLGVGNHRTGELGYNEVAECVVGGLGLRGWRAMWRGEGCRASG